MASGAVARPLASISASIGVKQLASRGFATVARRQQPLVSQLSQNTRSQTPARIPKDALRQSFRRGYADTINPVVKEKAKRRSWSFLKWSWRLLYVSAIGGTVYTAWGIHQSKYPREQDEPDPKKKTLVVLGRFNGLC